MRDHITKVARRVYRLLTDSRWTPAFAVFGIIALAIFVYLFSQVIGYGLFVLYHSLVGNSVEHMEELLRSSTTATFITRLLFTVAGIWLVKTVLKVTNMSWAKIGLKKPRAADIFYSLVGYGWYFLTFMLVMFMIRQFAPGIDLDQTQNIGFNRGPETTGLGLVFISLVILPAFYEEILTRGFLFTALRQRLPFVLTMIIVSVLFAVAHLDFGSGQGLVWIAALDTFVLSLALVYLREKTGSIWPCIGLHAFKNFVAFMALFVIPGGVL